MPQSVLLVDDSPEVHTLLEVRLRPEGLVILHAFDEDEAMAQAVELQPDLVLLDLQLRSTTGFEVCRRLKDEPRTAHIPIIFLTGTADVSSKVQGFDLGAVDYVTKPFDAAELRARVRAALRTKRFHDLLAVRAHVDGLTGLRNRAYFDQRLNDEVEAAKRYQRVVSLLMIDVDHFKSINDSYGHPFGDRVLESIGQVLTSGLRSADAACRYGGEEFAVILSETAEATGLLTAERLRAAISAMPFQHKERPVRVTASLGLTSSARFAAENLSPQALVAAADGALYRAKKGGRDQTCVATGSGLQQALTALDDIRR
jgi:diguanylate cyclase (GGDEF)-like protein